MSRLANGIVFIAVAILYADAVRLLRVGAAHPTNSYLLITSQFVAACAVIGLTAHDKRSVQHVEHDGVGDSTVGRLQKLATAMRSSDLATARHNVSELSSRFPTWGLPQEVAAYLDLLDGRSDLALNRLRALVAAGLDLETTPVIAAACAVRAGQLPLALDVIEQARPQLARADEAAVIEAAIRLQLGYFDEITAAPEPDAKVFGDDPLGDRWVGLQGVMLEKNVDAKRPGFLHLHAIDVPETDDLVSVLAAWHRDPLHDVVPTLSPTVPLSVLASVLFADPAHAVAVLSRSAGDCSDAATLETYGLALLAFDRPRDAIRALEKSVRAYPVAARVHWALAVGYQLVGWTDSAAAAIHRATTLAPSNLVYELTRDRLNGVPQAQAVEHDLLNRPLPNGERIELALLGYETQGIDAPTCAQETIAARLVELAIATRAHVVLDVFA